MASNKQKGKKKKEVTLTWQEFMKDSVSTAPVVSSWADEMENQNPDEEPEIIVHVNRAALPTAPRAVRGADIDESKIPSQPPYQAYIGNLPFEISEDDIRKFFKNLSVVNVKLQTDSVGRLRGFGYVEFETRQMLIESLAYNDLTIKNRSIRVDLATQNQGGDRDNRERRDDFHKRDDGEDRTSNDWRRKDDRASSDRIFRKDDRGEFDNRMGGSQRGYNRNNFGDRRDNDAFDRSRGFGGRQNFRDNFQNRDGYQNRERYERRDDRADGYGNRDNRGFDRRREFENRDFERRSEAHEEGWRQGTRNENRRDSSWRRDGSRDGTKQPVVNRRRDDEKDDVEKKPLEVSGPKERPKLNLMPRSKPLEDTQQPIATSSIFGGAKPVDTSQREREIEEKLKKMHVQRSSEDERKVSQSSDDGSQKRKKQDDSQQVKKERSTQVANQKTKKDSEECEELQQSPAPTLSPAPIKVVPAPVPKVNFWEARKSNQNQQPQMPAAANISALKEANESEVELCQDSSNSVPVRDNRVSSTTGDDEFEVFNESVKSEDATKTTAKVPAAARDVRHEPPKSNIWETRAKEREIKQKPEKEADKTVRRTAVSVGSAMRGRGASNQRGPNRRDEPVTAVVSVKQKQRPVLTSYEDMPKMEESSKKDWSFKNKFSKLMDENDDDEDDDSSTIRDDDEESNSADVKASSNHSNGSKRVAGYKKTEIQECA